jgi:SGNH hydrolase-like domain, acetyltransferase AlgX
MASDTLPTGGRAREAIAKIEIGETSVSATVARALLAFFLAAIAAVPVAEGLAARGAADGGPGVWSTLRQTPSRMSAAVQSAVTAGRTSLWQRVLAGNRALLADLSAFEDGLEDESVVGRTLRPPAQEILSGWLGAGNERVYIGRDGWLFFRPDLEYLTADGFLEPRALARRVSAAREWTAPPQPDPRPAILEFRRQLAARGIVLVVVPTPVKPGVHPEKLVGSYSQHKGIVQNPSFGAFVEWLSSQGILFFDPDAVLGDRVQSAPQYLATDTHWRPEAMELVAERLAAFVAERAAFPPVQSTGFRIEEREVTSAGDTVAMLDVREGQRRYPPEKVVISRVLAGDGGPWRSDRTADVLVLGDSFANIYSLASMGWGDAAGLVEHLSYALGRPVDRIVQNDAGAFATREMLERSGPERLDGKRVVIWQFAVRELASGDWKVR